ncbi:serine protease [Roseateles sp. BYS180W]|uniref:Serine protease n=1 Tax=Roseateles rivi TaxID=3299028 RepID=A0ABW7FRM6_9BURK
MTIVASLRAGFLSAIQQGAMRQALWALAALCWACAAAAQGNVSPLPAAAASSAVASPPVVSADAKRLYEHKREHLLQVRTVLVDQDSQATVGSGFVVSPEGHVITNYHVVSQFLLDPQRYRLRYQNTWGQSGELQVLAFDVRRDLALLRVVGAPAEMPHLSFRAVDKPLAKGERIYAMGNPEDIAFAIVEGNFNGLVERSFDPLIYYAGGLNPGMSGGPVLDDNGEVVGINVAGQMFAQQISFLIPGEFANQLLQRARQAVPVKGNVWPELQRQLQAYQNELVGQFLQMPWRNAGHDRYRLPVPQERFMRCWGKSSATQEKGMRYQSMQCRMDHAIYVSDRLQTGYISVQHSTYDGRELGTARFTAQYSDAFKKQHLGRSGSAVTAPHCVEEFVRNNDGPVLRSVACLSAYRKLTGLYDLTVLVASADAAQAGTLGRLDANGVTMDSARRLTRHFLQGYAWNKPASR